MRSHICHPRSILQDEGLSSESKALTNTFHGRPLTHVLMDLLIHKARKSAINAQWSLENSSKPSKKSRILQPKIVERCDLLQNLRRIHSTPKYPELDGMNQGNSIDAVPL